MKRTNCFIRKEELADLYASLLFFTKYYDDAEEEIQIVLDAIVNLYRTEYPGDTTLEVGNEWKSYLRNRRNAGRKSKLSKQDIREIVRQKQEHIPVRDIATQFHVSERYIYKILNNV